MKFLQNIYSAIFNKQRMLFSTALILFIIFHKPIELLLTNTIIKYALSYVESVWYNDAIFSLVVLSALILLISRFKKYTPSKNLFFFLISITIIYAIYRTTCNVWVFTPFSFSVNFKYADVLIIACVFNLFLFVKAKQIDRKNGNGSFFDDEPIGEKKIDELGYTPYAELLASKIKSSHFDKAFAIGINGKWGLGKTSFIDLLKRKIKGSEIIEINFNPWNSNSPKAIIQDFFGTVQESIRPYHSSLSRLLISYSNKLVSLNDNTMTQSIQTSVTAITGFESLNSLFEDINNSLKKINKKIIVYIDDLDRLDKDEIIEVIRLVRNTANFHNTFFIVAYDRNYVVNALKSHNPYKQEQFLEKIFQIEVTLPYFKKDIFRYKLAEKLKEKFPIGFHTIINEEIIGSTSVVPVFLNEWLESMRDVTRLANALVLNLSKLNGEVDFNDFLRLELLRVKYPSVYELLFKRTNDFLTLSHSSSEKQRYVLVETSDNPKQKYLKVYLNENYSELSVPLNDINKIVSFIDGIFEDSLMYSYYTRKHLSVVFPSKFNRYFAYNLLEGSLSEIEFSKARALSSEEFNKKITEWVKQNLEFELKSRFAEIKSFDNREDFEKVINAIFHLANQMTLNPNMFSRQLVGYDGKDLYDKLSNYENKLAVRYYSDLNEAEGLKQFVLKLFKNAKSPFSFEADFIRYANNEFSDSFPLSKDELKGLVLDYFKTYCSETEKLDSNVWSLFHDCKQTNWNPTGGGSYQKQEILPEETKEIMKTFVLSKDLDGFLLALIDPEPFDQKKFAISNFIVGLFGDWQAFKEILEQQSEEKWKNLNEFKKLLLEYETKNFSQYVDFKFEQIPIEQKIRK